MKRLTELHFKKTDGFYMKCSEHCCKEDFSCEDCEEFEKLVDRLGSIEDILGDEYDLDRLREFAQSDREGRHGHWARNRPDDIVLYCSECMMPQDAPSNYCPSCGARMEKEDEHA